MLVQDEHYMKLAIEEAKKGKGFVAPNPLVGAVIVKDNNVIGIGYHKKYGDNHAEVNAILDAKKNNIDISNSTIYVTLEPCSHYGKTPPCVNAIIENKFRRVVIGCVDINPKVSGSGILKLRDAGIEVTENVLEEECRKLNEIFFYHIKNKMPFVAIKYAMTIDGKIATESGKSKWITSEKSRKHSHTLRQEYTAIMVGINTVIFDDPILNCRLENNSKNPIRVIVDSSLKIPIDSNIIKTSKSIKTYIATISNDVEKIKCLESFGAEVIVTSIFENKVNLKELMLHLYNEKNIDSILVDGGAILHSSLLREKLVSKFFIYIAPKIFGGLSAKTPIGNLFIDEPNDAIKLINGKISNIDEDLFLEYDLEF